MFESLCNHIFDETIEKNFLTRKTISAFEKCYSTKQIKISQDTQITFELDTKQTAIASAILFDHYSYNIVSRKLYSYLALKDNWDGYGGKTPEKSIINTTKEALDFLQKQAIKAPKIMLSGSGEIGLYWEDGKRYAEISCESTNEYSFIYINDKSDFYGEEYKDIKDKFSFEIISKLSSFKV